MHENSPKMEWKERTHENRVNIYPDFEQIILYFERTVYYYEEVVCYFEMICYFEQFFR